MTAFMQAADLFEDFKVISQINNLDIHFKDGEEVTYERAAKLLNNIVEGIRSINEIPVFVHLVAITGEDTILKNKKLKVPYYRDEKIKVISSGHSWFMLDDFIKAVIK